MNLRATMQVESVPTAESAMKAGYIGPASIIQTYVLINISVFIYSRWRSFSVKKSATLDCPNIKRRIDVYIVSLRKCFKG